MSAELPDFVITPRLGALLLLEVGVLLAGLGMLFRARADLSARLCGKSMVRLSPAAYPITDLFLGALFTIAGGILAQSIAVHLARIWFPLAADGTPGLFEVFVGAGFQLGLLAGFCTTWLYLLQTHRNPPPLSPPDAPPRAELPSLDAAQAALAGARAFVVLLPVVWLGSLLWKTLLHTLGVDAPPQQLVLIFIRTGDDAALAAMIFFAVVVAPVTEELLFRVGLFRWLRTRVPRAVSLLVPSALFSLLHFSWAAFLPLALLAVGLAIAYERSGHPLTSITAHALFNLNTIALLLAGLPV